MPINFAGMAFVTGESSSHEGVKNAEEDVVKSAAEGETMKTVDGAAEKVNTANQVTLQVHEHFFSQTCTDKIEMLIRRNDGLLLEVDQMSYYKRTFTRSENLFNDITKYYKYDMATLNLKLFDCETSREFHKEKVDVLSKEVDALKI